MKVQSAFKRIDTAEVDCGQLVIVFQEDKPTLAMTVSWPGGPSLQLLLEGPDAGKIEHISQFEMIVLTDPIVVELPRRARRSISNQPPADKSLFAVVDGPDTYFAFRVKGELAMVNIETGSCHSFKHTGFYIAEWELWPEDSERREPLVSSK